MTLALMMNDTTIQQFLTHQRVELNRSELTVISYRSDLRQFEQYLAGRKEMDWASVTVNDVRAWLVQRSSLGDSARTLRRKVQSLRAMYKWLMRHGMAEQNPAADIEMARLPKRLPHLLRPQNLDMLLDSEVDLNDFEQVRNHLMLLMLYTTGIRRAELIGLRDAWVDTQALQLRVHGKRDKDRIVPFGTELAQWVERYRQLRDSEVPRTELFFVRPDGKPLYPSLVYRVVHDALLTVGGGDQLSPHVLRHSFASAMLNDGADITSVKELLGHESLAATQIYTHITLSELKTHYKLAHPRALKKGG
ncbi:MAG: tyrosine-type recombinase/integrase [Muribaculaceae bacterium]|nr:tyrosine-type recombinase/integrase [Muribaculaceae bacterium]MBR1727871.1 tyrosine-type recombinase/integrase [Muribaculaceae bacterium]